MPKPNLEKEFPPEKKSWEELCGRDVSKLIQSGWKLNRLMQRFNVSNIQIIRKLTKG